MKSYKCEQFAMVIFFLLACSKGNRQGSHLLSTPLIHLHVVNNVTSVVDHQADITILIMNSLTYRHSNFVPAFVERSHSGTSDALYLRRL